MTHLEMATDLQTMVGLGQVLEAIDKYYADDIVIVEANGDSFTGKDTQKERVVEWQKGVQDTHGGGLRSICGSADDATVTAETWMDVTWVGGPRSSFEEVAVQTWKDGKVIRERFYYYIPSEMQGAM